MDWSQECGSSWPSVAAKNRHTKAHKGSNLDESMDNTILQDEFDTDDETEPLPDQDRFDAMPVYSCMKSFIRSAYPFEEVSDQISNDSMKDLDSDTEISLLNDSKFYLGLKICTGCNDNSEALYSCLECKDTLCELCYQAHLKVRLTRNHTLSQLPLK